jgi:hypothetical protein
MFFKDAWQALFYGRNSPVEIVSETKYILKVIELRGPRVAQAWTKEIKQAVGTLVSHPGFIALVDRLNLQRQMLANKSSHEFHKDIREADILTAGVLWLGYVQDLVNKATQLPAPAPVDAYAEEIEAHRVLDAQIERIGMETQSPARN